MSKILNISLISVFFVVTLFSLGMSQSESLSITTYYPSPVGTYRELRWGANTSSNRGILSSDQGASIELGGNGTAPYIDFSNDTVVANDFDARIILRSDDQLNIEGANVGIGTQLQFFTNFGAPPNATIIFRPGNGLEINGVSYSLGIGVTPNPANALDVAGRTNINGDLNVTGNAYALAFNTTSDLRLKDIIGKYENGLDAVNQINIVRFKYKKDNPLGLFSDKERVGVIAQQIQNIIPEAVEADKDGYLDVNTAPIIYTMLNAIKQQQSEIELLKKEINELKTKVK